MATRVYVIDAVLPTDTSTLDVTVSEETSDSPDGCIVVCSTATSLSTNTNDAIYSYGFSDFTNEYSVGYQSEHGVGTTNGNRTMRTTVIGLLDPGAATIDRSATVTAITGGIRLTPVQSGSAFRIMVTLIFGTSCYAFTTEGDGTLDDTETVAIGHAFENPPKFGVFGFANIVDDGSGTDARLSIGMFADNLSGSPFPKQHSWTVFRNDGQTTTSLNSYLSNAYVVGNNSGTSLGWAMSVTSNDVSSTTFTVDLGSALTGANFCGMLVEANDIEVDIEAVAMPTTAAADWDYTSLAFEPQAILGIATLETSVDNGRSNSNIAGTVNFFGVDATGREVTISTAEDNNVTTTDTSSRIDQNIYSTNDDATVEFDMTNLTFTSDGWTVASADITAVNGGTVYWPILSLGKGAGGLLSYITHEVYYNGQS